MAQSIAARIVNPLHHRPRGWDRLPDPFPAFVTITLTFFFFTTAGAQIPRGQTTRPAACVSRAPASGINTSRLAGQALEQWCAIERLARTTELNGRPRYPMLNYLLTWAESSDYAIFIELPESRMMSCTAGTFEIERLDPGEGRHQAVIRLYLTTIDRAHTVLSNRRENDLLPFLGLTKEERYAEVLGHELGHAYHILSDFELSQLVTETVQQTNQKFAAFRIRHPRAPLDPQMLKLMAQKDTLLETLEAAALAFEKIVWRELLDGGKSAAKAKPTPGPNLPLTTVHSDALGQ